MQGRVKNLLQKVKNFRDARNREPKFDSFCNESQIERDMGAILTDTCGAELNSSNTQSNQSSECEYEEEIVQSKCPRPNFATVLVILMLFVVFVVLPVVYLLHCFDLLNSHWPSDEMKKIVIDHSHSNPRLEEDSSTAVKSYLHKNTIDAGNNILHLAKLHTDAEVRKETILSNPAIPSLQECKAIPDSSKFDCHPENNPSQESCEARGCCWAPKLKMWKKNIFQDFPAVNERSQINVPYCFYPSGYGGYKYLNVSKTTFGLSAYLKRTFKSVYPDDIQLLKMDIVFETQERLHVKVFDPLHKRFEPPYPEVPSIQHAPPLRDYQVVVDEKKLGFKVIRKKNQEILFNTQDVGGFICSDQFLQMSALLPSSFIYGLGEHRSSLMLSTNWERFTMFNHDSPPKERANLYGSHPFYLMMEKSGYSHGVFLLNSNAMDVILQPAPAITFRAIGGVLDFYFFLGPSPQKVVQQYTDIIGKPYMPPYWGLGFHLCRFGYKSLNKTREVWQRTRAAGIPLDTQWNDLDYMNKGNDFTYDRHAFKDLPEFVNELHQVGMHYIPLIDAGISGAEPAGTYPPYDKGLEMDIFVKNSSGKPFVGKVWNRVSTVWPDFTHPKTVDYWINLLSDLHKEILFDGAWIDMNEPSNFYSGSADGCPDSSLENPPYLPAVDGGKLFYRTLCMTAHQYAGKHYDVHNLHGYTQSIVTSFAMAEIREKRPFVISRSTFAGQGHYAGHWSGDIFSSWYDMKMTIPELLSFNMFGIPLMGADICGFNGNTTASLCQRWMQLGAFYPFSRNHNSIDSVDQDPVALGKDVVRAAKNALYIRYRLLPYLYTLFWKAHVLGDTVARPLFFEFPNDNNTYGLDEQFLWGSGLLIVPVLEEGKTEVEAYLPQAVWYDYHSLRPLYNKGKKHTLSAPLHKIPLLVRGGNVLPLQEPNATTTDSRKNKFELLVAQDEDGEASGCLYWDDGDTLNTWEDNHYTLVNFTLKENKLSGHCEWWGFHEDLQLARVTVLGVEPAVTQVLLNDLPTPFDYDVIRKSLKLENLNVNLRNPFTVKWT